MYGTPVLGANIGGICRADSGRKTGELFESADAADLKEKSNIVGRQGINSFLYRKL